MRVRVSVVARTELEAIVDYIAQDNEPRAVSFGVELLERCEGLADHARRHPVVRRMGDREIRRTRHGRYLVFYSITDDVVEVHHIVHQSRDYMRLLFPGD